MCPGPYDAVLVQATKKYSGNCSHINSVCIPLDETGELLFSCQHAGNTWYHRHASEELRYAY